MIEMKQLWPVLEVKSPFDSANKKEILILNCLLILGF